jgi:aldehyde dehydrogenase (NAD(P)+)
LYSHNETAELLPWTLVRDLDSPDASARAFGSESFCPILFETQVGAETRSRFWIRPSLCQRPVVGHPIGGTGGASQDHEGRVLAGSVGRAIADLRHGAVCVNAWVPQGAHPSRSLEDMPSGIGWVHNTPMLEQVEKAVLRHPLTAMPKPHVFPQSPERPQADAPDEGLGGERELEEGACGIRRGVEGVT